MPSYKIQIEQRALLDIRQACNYYEEQQPGLGVRFNQSVFHSFDALSNNPFYQVRYDSFRCLPVKKFLYMIHFEVDETNGIVIVYAVINTKLDPAKNWPLS